VQSTHVTVYRVLNCTVLYACSVLFATISAIYNADDFGVVATDGDFLSTPAALTKSEGIYSTRLEKC